MSPIFKEIESKIEKLDHQALQELISFIDYLGYRSAINVKDADPPKKWLELAGSLDDSDAELMKHCINDECERVDHAEW